MPVPVLLRYLLLPAHLTVVVFTAVVSLGLTMASYAGWYGVPVEVMLLSWLFNYAFILLEAIANGAHEPPVLAIEMLNPTHESRPLFLLALVLVATSLLSLVAVFVDAPLAAAMAVLGFIALPASTGALAVGTSVWQAVHPSVVWHIARTLGASYLMIVAVVLGYGILCWELARTGALPTWPLIALAVFAWLSAFALIGGSLFEHREILGHEPTDSPERRAARVDYEIERKRSLFLDRVHFEARAGNLPGAWDSIERELAEHKHDFDYYDWLLERLVEREDQRLAARLAQDYIGRALERDNARVTMVAQRLLRIDASFRPRSGAQCLRVAELLRLSGDRQSARTLLSDFATQFPQDPAIPLAQSLLATLDR